MLEFHKEVLGPILYTIVISDMLICNGIAIATCADYTAILAISISPSDTLDIVQGQLHATEKWFRKWNIIVNIEKWTHFIFSLREQNRPSSK